MSLTWNHLLSIYLCLFIEVQPTVEQEDKYVVESHYSELGHLLFVSTKPNHGNLQYLKSIHILPKS